MEIHSEEICLRAASTLEGSRFTGRFHLLRFACPRLCQCAALMLRARFTKHHEKPRSSCSRQVCNSHSDRRDFLFLCHKLFPVTLVVELGRGTIEFIFFRKQCFSTCFFWWYCLACIDGCQHTSSWPLSRKKILQRSEVSRKRNILSPSLLPRPELSSATKRLKF